MKCPNCTDATLLMMERQGVEIDYCPQCRGVWLDRGELDKLIERSASAAPPPPAQAPYPAAPQQAHAAYAAAQHHRDFKDSDYHHNTGYPQRKRKSWLGEIFD